jgi:hypothetical protein
MLLLFLDQNGYAGYHRVNKAGKMIRKNEAVVVS